MITSTVGALLDGCLDALDVAGHTLYLVGDGETVFYIGRSRDPVGRLWQHLGLTLTGGQLWRPCLNCTHNDNPARLPDRYRRGAA